MVRCSGFWATVLGELKQKPVHSRGRTSPAVTATTMNTASFLASAARLVGHRSMIAMGLKRRRDGWRRAACIVLRRECGTFVLSAFGLHALSDAASNIKPSRDELYARVGKRLSTFLAKEPLIHVRVVHGEYEDTLEQCSTPAYTLAFEEWVEGPARFLPPKLWRYHAESPATLGHGHDPCVDIICRCNDDGTCDVWLRFNHAVTDGVPAQELVLRLEQAWGHSESTIFPTPEEFSPLCVPRPSPGRDGLAELHTFVDLSTLLAWRKRENATLKEPMTLSAALSWHLAAHPHFARHHIASTVEIAPKHDLPAGVGVVVTAPAAFHAMPGGIARFTRDFNAQIERNRLRVSSACTSLDAAAFLSAKNESALLRHILSHMPKAFGSLGLTILKDAKVFGAPIGFAGHDHGFLALGSAALPTRDGRKVACISVKGLAKHIASYPTLLREALPPA